MTLVETAMSIAILTIVMGAMTSAVVVASKAMPGRNDRIEAVLHGARLADRLLADLAYARSITLTGAGTLRAVVPDRDNDAIDEIIVYSWSGTKGDPVYRTYNAEVPALFAAAAWEFVPSCQSRTATIATTVMQESTEQLLHYQPVANAGAPTGLMNPYTSGNGNKDVTNSRWLAQHVQPVLPQGATAWSITRVLLAARVSGTNNGWSRVEIRPATTFPGGPSSSVIQGRDMFEWNLNSSYGWETFSFSSVTGLDPVSGIWVVVRWVNNGTSGTIAYQDKDVADQYAAYAESSNSGSTWSQTADGALAHAIYGTYTVPVAATATQVRATTLSIRLNLSSDSGAVVETASRLAAEPLLVVNP